MTHPWRSAVLLVLSITGLAVAAPPKEQPRVSPNTPATRPKGIDLSLSTVTVTRKPGTTDTYLLTIWAQNWGKTTKSAGVVLRATRTTAGPGPMETWDDSRIVQEITLPVMTPLLARSMTVEYRISDLAAAPAIFGLTKFELLTAVSRGPGRVEYSPFSDVNNRNNSIQITGTDLVTRIRAL
jgi:hypothetical protein